jgi:hypothetical protein
MTEPQLRCRRGDAAVSRGAPGGVSPPCRKSEPANAHRVRSGLRTRARGRFGAPARPGAQNRTGTPRFSVASGVRARPRLTSILGATASLAAIRPHAQRVSGPSRAACGIVGPVSGSASSGKPAALRRAVRRGRDVRVRPGRTAHARRGLAGLAGLAGLLPRHMRSGLMTASGARAALKIALFAPTTNYRRGRWRAISSRSGAGTRTARNAGRGTRCLRSGCSTGRSQGQDQDPIRGRTAPRP